MQQHNQAQLDQQLRQFSGTENYYKHMSGKVYSDGVQYLASQYGTYWLLDEILFIVHKIKEEFQVWKLTRKGVSDVFQLTCEDGNKKIVFKKEIPFSDFSANTVELWYANNVLYLPSEH
jgi:hypothetical protein